MIALNLSRSRRTVWWISLLLVGFSLAGIVLCWTNPTIKAPLRPGLDFTGGTQIQLERQCVGQCQSVQVDAVQAALKASPLPAENGEPAPNLDIARVQLLDLKAP